MYREEVISCFSRKRLTWRVVALIVLVVLVVQIYERAALDVHYMYVNMYMFGIVSPRFSQT